VDVRILKIKKCFFLSVILAAFLAGCEATSHNHRTTFSELSPDERLKYAQEQLSRQEAIFRQAMNSFLHFMNDNQAKWIFRIPNEYSVSVMDENHYMVNANTKPYSHIVSIGSIMAINKQQDIKVYMTFHGDVSLELAWLGWDCFVVGWGSAEIHGESVSRVLRGFTKKDTSELDEFADNFDEAMNCYFATYFGRTKINYFSVENIKDNMLHNPLFF
jgi:hypothetical protein